LRVVLAKMYEVMNRSNGSCRKLVLPNPYYQPNVIGTLMLQCLRGARCESSAREIRNFFRLTVNVEVNLSLDVLRCKEKQSTVETSYKGVGLCVTSSTASDIQW